MIEAKSSERCVCVCVCVSAVGMHEGVCICMCEDVHVCVCVHVCLLTLHLLDCPDFCNVRGICALACRKARQAVPELFFFST